MPTDPDHGPDRVEPAGTVRTVLDRVADGFVAVDTAWRVVYANRRAAEILRASDGALVGNDLWALFPALVGTTFERQYRRAMSGQVPVAFEEHFAPLGLTLEISAYPDPDGLSIYARDVTQHRRADAALRASEQRFRGLVESAHEGVWAVDAVGRTTYVNPRLTQLLGVPAEGIVGRSMFDFMEPEVAFQARTRFARRQRGIAEAHELSLRRADGGVLRTQVSSSPLLDADGRFAGEVALVTDVTERRRAEQALAASEERLRLALAAARMTAWELDLRSDAFVEAANDGDPGYLGGTEPCTSYAALLAAVHPDEREAIERARARAHAGGTDFRAEFRTVVVPGEARWHHATGRVLRDADGAPERIVGVVADVTAHKALEAQLRQAQKMEAVGQLAGGVAHDFNNLLTVIGASTRFARESLPAGAEALDDLTAVDEAARRAADLTRQLLAFSRKQLLKPELLDLHEVVRGVEPMLRRLIGEDIAVVTRPAPELDPVLADPGQLEQVLVNLAVNARDAMPHGGTLTIATTHVEVPAGAPPREGAPLRPGRYVRLSVCDTGVGMDERTRVRVFDPFFTTKAAGAGTGLGLATAYGIVKQSGGYVWVTSAPGAGAAFDVDLPSAAATARPAIGPGDAAAPPPAGRRCGTVLVVEDEPAVRDIVRRVLVRQGYTVLQAANGREALTVAERHAGRIDLAVTDMVMPELSGRAFAERLRAAYPEVPVLYMSGYTDDEIVRRGLRTQGSAFLEKPFTAERLATAVREAIGEAG